LFTSLRAERSISMTHSSRISSSAFKSIAGPSQDDLTPSGGLLQSGRFGGTTKSIAGPSQDDLTPSGGLLQSGRFGGAVNPLSPRRSPLVTPERPLSPLVWSQYRAVGDKRPPSVEHDVEASPNKLRRLTSPPHRWAAATATDFVVTETAVPKLTDLEVALMLNERAALLENPPSPTSGSDPFTADADESCFLDHAPGWVNATHSLEDAPEVAVQKPPARARRPLKLADLTQPAHRDMVSKLQSQHYKSLDIAFVLRFLSYLENLKLNWHVLRGDTSNPRPIELETQVNAAMNSKEIKHMLRPVLNQIYGLMLQGEAGMRPAWPVKWTIHQNFLANSIPTTASIKERGHLSSLLGYLETQGIGWSVISAPRPGEHPKRPIRLEEFISTAIANKKVDKSTRSTVNNLFGFLIQRASHSKYKLPEHTDLVNKYFEKMIDRHKSYVVIFLGYLESIGSSWSRETALSEGEVNSKRPTRLEKTVNFATSKACKTALHGNTRASLNAVFGLNLEGVNMLKPKIPEHIFLLSQIPAVLPNGDSNINRRLISKFFSHLEKKGELFSDLKKIKPGDQPKQPVELEAIVNKLIADHHISDALRMALNQVFDLRLRNPLGVCSWPPEETSS
jgi:hypothetical protein